MAIFDRDSTDTIQTDQIIVPTRTHRWAIELQDEEGSRRVPLGSSPLVVGSSRRADITIRDPTVSSRHCEVIVTPTGVVITDLGSRNGTFAGGARVEKALGVEGTAITIGRTTLVCIPAEDEPDEEDPRPLPGLAGASTAMRRISAQVRRLARLSAPVLVCGETGAGKELVSRALHTEGPRRDAPFVAMNVAALPRELLESEPFGHERGAFTGAGSRRAGAFNEAEGGTIFPDGIGELPLDAQPKVLRALDGYEVRRVGGAGSGQRANSRVVVATHVSLSDRVARGLFRRDLFHRLEVFIVDVPPLRERRGDIFTIARSILSNLEPELGNPQMTPGALARLTAHDWPGNIRELRNVLLRAADFARATRWIDAKSVERAFRTSKETIHEISLTAAQEQLQRYNGNVSAAARAAGVPRTTFRKALRPGTKKK